MIARFIERSICLADGEVMGRKDKKKDSKTRNDEKRNNKGGRDTRKHKGKNWKADQNDPIRKAVEAGTCHLHIVIICHY